MRRGKWIVLVLTLLFAAAATVIGKNEIGTLNFPFSVMITSDGEQEELHCMKLGGEYYIFLPGYADGQNAKIHTNLVYDVSIGGQWLTEGQSCGDFPMNIPLELYFRSGGNQGYETITFVQSGNVGAMYIDVPSGNMEYIHEEKGHEEPAGIRLYTKEGKKDYSGFAESVKGRGNATWEADKKSYSLKLQSEYNLLNMGKAQNWILLSNAYDLTHIRNKVAYDAAAAAGMAFTPETNWVDLYLNGEYAGLYLLSERNEVHSQRVQIPTETGFLVSLEFPYRLAEQGYPHVTTQRGLALRIHHSAAAEQELTAIWQSVENAILAEDGIDPVSGKRWDELIDLDSWAHKYLLEELFGNFDAGSISQYFYCDTSDPQAKIYAGPIWDFDNSMGRGGWITSNPRSFLANRAHFFSEDDAPLFHGLYQKPAFYDRVVELFVSVYEPLFADLLNGGLQSYAERIPLAAAADRKRWGVDTGEDVENIETFLKERLEFYHDLWINRTEYCTVEMTVDFSSWGCYAVEKGSCMSQLPEGQWYDLDTDKPFDITQPVVTNRRIYRKPE